MKDRRRSVKIRIALFMGLVAFAVVAALVLRPRPLDEDARQYVAACFDGNVGYVASRVPDYELAKIGMSRRELRRFLASYLLPKFRLGRLKRIRTSFNQADGMNGIALCTIEAAGERFELGCMVQKSDDGPIRLLREVLQDAWEVEYEATTHDPDPTDLREKASLWALKRDRSELEQLGFHGFAYDVEDQSTIGLDAAIVRLQSVLDEPKTPGRIDVSMPRR